MNHVRSRFAPPKEFLAAWLCRGSRDGGPCPLPWSHLSQRFPPCPLNLHLESKGGHLQALRTPRLLEQTPGMSLGKDRRGHPSCRYCRLSHPSGTSGSRTCTDLPPPTVATLHLPQLNQTAASERGWTRWEGKREGQCPYEQDFRKSLVLREREMGKTKRDPQQER